MAQAKRDQNAVTTLLATSGTDATTPIAIQANPFTHRLSVMSTIAPGAANSVAQRDENRVPVLLAVSSADGVTPVVVYADPITNSLFIKKTP